MTKPIDSFKSTLRKYTTEPIADYISETFSQVEYQLVISRQRSSKLGDYSPPFKNRQYHRISVNGNLNQYSFFITFLHELAHLYCWIKYKNKVKIHGQEWKNLYSELLKEAMMQKLFPDDITLSLNIHLTRIKSSTSFDYQLINILNKYDNPAFEETQTEVGVLKKGDVFEFKGKSFKFEKIMRKRALCFLIPELRKYSFSPFVKVDVIKI